MGGGVFSKNIWEETSERRNENIIVSGPLKSRYSKSFTVAKVAIKNKQIKYLAENSHL